LRGSQILRDFLKTVGANAQFSDARRNRFDCQFPAFVSRPAPNVVNPDDCVRFGNNRDCSGSLSRSRGKREANRE
jgi:hypothetical protein